MIIKKVEIVSGGQSVGRCSVTDTREFHGLKVEYHPWQMLNLVGVLFEKEGLFVIHENQNRMTKEQESDGWVGTFESYGDKKIGSQVKLVGADSPLMIIERIEQVEAFDYGMCFYCRWTDARGIIRKGWFHEHEILTH